MDIKSQIVSVPCVQTKDNELIPIWDERIKYDDTEGDGFFGDVLFEGNHVRVVSGYIDINTKKISGGTIINVKEKERDGLTIGTDVVVETKFGRVKIDKIVDIIYEDENYDVIYGKGINVRQYSNVPKEVEIKDDELYEVRSYKSTWVLESGTKVYWSHQMKILEK